MSVFHVLSQIKDICEVYYIVAYSKNKLKRWRNIERRGHLWRTLGNRLMLTGVCKYKIYMIFEQSSIQW